MVVTAVMADLTTVMTIVPVMAIVAAVAAVITPLPAVVTATTVVIGEGRATVPKASSEATAPTTNRFMRMTGLAWWVDGSIMRTPSERSPAGNGFQFKGFDPAFRRRQAPAPLASGGIDRFRL
jgi:hypothetical protein